jgi:hypothetical protein
VRGKSVSDEKGEYAADGLKADVKAWEESSERLAKVLNDLSSRLNSENVR